MVYYRILNIISCAIQQDLLIYFIYSILSLLIQTPNVFLPHFPFVSHNFVFYICESIFWKYVYLYHTLDSTNKWYHIFVCLFLIYFLRTISRPFMLLQIALFHSFLWLSSIPMYHIFFTHSFRASLVAQLVKNLPAMRETGFNPWVRKICWKRERLTTLVFWLGEFHGLYSLWGRKESDITEWLSLHFTSFRLHLYLGYCE